MISYVARTLASRRKLKTINESYFLDPKPRFIAAREVATRDPSQIYQNIVRPIFCFSRDTSKYTIGHTTYLWIRDTYWCRAYIGSSTKHLATTEVLVKKIFMLT